ncbi:MAG: hypothetical protein PHF29_03440 [Candidatus Riflebacteria bacterium]|nr:hypothetical protein [Candidatus Riflebacteria bacterium]
MLALSINSRQNISVVLVLSMLFSIWLTVAPINRAEASFLGNIGGTVKSIFVNVGGLAAGALAAVAGMAIGGGPLGMAIGGLAGFIVGKKVLNWTTSSVANFATVAGAIGGGLLCAGMGFPMLAIGVIGGGLLGRLITKGVTALLGKGKNIVVAKSDMDPAAAAKESKEIENYIASLNAASSKSSPAAKSTYVNVETTSTAVPTNSEEAYRRYSAAYKEYTEAAQQGDSAKAKAALESYRKYFELYSALLNQGK